MPEQLSLFTAASPVESCAAGLFLTRACIWLDAHSPQDLSFVSHAHSDHICRHRKALMTAATRRFFDLRLHHHRTEITELEYNRPWPIGESSATLFPAGHILGSAQVLIEDGQRIVYTGDVKLRTGPAVEPAEVKTCDILIMEATFGLPQYVFPPLEEVAAQLKTELDRALNRGRPPVIKAYPLGKAQVVVALLNQLGYRVLVDENVGRYCRIYEQLGMSLGPFEELPDAEPEAVGALSQRDSGDSGSESRQGSRSHGPEVRVISTGRSRDGVLPANTYRVFVSGWGIDPKAKYRYGVDIVVPLSDHADFPELLEYVRRAEPKQVYVTHGPADFAATLRRQGFDARYLESGQ